MTIKEAKRGAIVRRHHHSPGVDVRAWLLDPIRGSRYGQASGAPGARMTDTQHRAGYPHWTTVTLRYSDQDSMGHVNNVSYAAYVEAGRVAFEHAHMFPLLAKRQDFYL